MAVARGTKVTMDKEDMEKWHKVAEEFERWTGHHGSLVARLHVGDGSIQLAIDHPPDAEYQRMSAADALAHDERAGALCHRVAAGVLCDVRFRRWRDKGRPWPDVHGTTVTLACDEEWREAVGLLMRAFAAIKERL